MYERFLSLPHFDDRDLEELQNSTAAVVGLGATGSAIAENLARHGVKLILIDRDFLEEKDLYTSSLYTKEDVEKSLPKAVAAENKLEELTETRSVRNHLDASNISILDEADIVLDGTDNLETRFMINDYAKKTSKPWIYTAAISQKGYSKFFGGTDSCFNCIFEEIQAGSLETCETAGILREVSQMAGARSAMKAVQYLSDRDVSSRLEVFPSGERFDVRSEGCKVCRKEEFPHLEKSTDISTVCGEQKFQIVRDDVNVEKGFEKLRKFDVLADNSYLIRSEVNGKAIVLFRSGRAILEAENQDEAISRYSEILGI